jgi:hypothetical protein
VSRHSVRSPSFRPAIAAALAIGAWSVVWQLGIAPAYDRDLARHASETALSATAAPIQQQPAVQGDARNVGWFQDHTDGTLSDPSEPIGIDVNPCFPDLPTGGGTDPQRVTLENHTSQSVTAQVQVEVAFSSASDRVVREVSLPAQTRRDVFVYPRINAYSSASLMVTVRSPLGESTMPLPNPYSGIGSPVSGRMIGVIGRISVAPETHQNLNTTVKTLDTDEEMRLRLAAHARVASAPDRSDGYSPFSTVVVNPDTAALTRDQWGAIHNWVIRGGSLIALSASAPADYGATAAAALPAPSESLPLPGFLADIIGPLAPMGRAHLGMGTILYVPCAAAAYELRQHPLEFVKLWTTLSAESQPVVRPWVAGFTDGPDLLPPTSAAAPGGDVFSAPLPSLASVVYVFVGYFVLAIPVTFVVLRRMRRSNLAWVTGPVLAVGVAAATYGFTGSLYHSPLSRRTAGLVIAAAGDGDAQFVGRTDMFFPRGGRYDLGLTGLEELSSADNDAVTPSGSGANALRRLTIHDDGRQLTLPEFAVPNLAFRSVSYIQHIPWGSGITAELSEDPATGVVTGYVTNGTGRTLNGAEIFVPLTKSEGAQVKAAREAFQGNSEYQLLPRKFIECGSLPPGETAIHATPTLQWLNRASVSDEMSRETDWLRIGGEKEPILFGTLSGSDLGPQIGAWTPSPGTETGVAIVLPSLLDAKTAPNPGPSRASSQANEGGRK